MVSEYASEIFEYLRKLEATILPDPDYMKMQPELTWSTRGTLADWMLALHNSLKLLPETYWLAMNLLDRFLSRRSVALAKFQLLGVACHMAAAKYTEILAPTARQWVTSSDGSFTKRTLILAERYILKVLEFKVGSPNPLDFLRRISKVDDYDAQLRALAKFLALIQCFTPGLLGIPPSLLAASAYWLARVCLERFNWTDKHVEYSGYNEDQLIPHAQAMIAYLLEPVEHESLHRIWSWKKNFKAATFLRDWATKNWSRPEPGSKAVILPIDIKLGLLRMKTGAVNEPDNDHP
ncbi:G2/mitotic-specific cyclin [Tulasnella sp. 427]|nr:G2/mitotic-specific cyclin [Tulasnella sp. 427]